MEEDEIKRQVCKFQRVSSNGSTTSDNSSNPHKIATHLDGGGGGGGRLCGWPSSRIVRVSRASGGKDRHSKVLTSKGLRDRRVRLSVSTAIQFYDLQDRLGYDQPSKAVEWLLKAAATSIEELPSLDPSFHHHSEDPNHQSNNVSKSSACSSTSETSKGSGLSLSRSENRIKARERAREMATMKEKEFDSTPTAAVLNGVSQNSSFTDLLTGGGRSPMDYFFGRTTPPPFHITTGDDNHQHHQQQQQQLSFLQENFSPVGTAAGDGETYNLNFSMASSSSGAGLSPGFNRGTLQSNLPSSLLAQHHLQRFQPSQMDGSASTNLPFFIVPNAVTDPFQATGGYDAQRLQLYYGGGGQSDQHKDKAKN